MREPAFWWRRAGLCSALLSPLALFYDAVASRRLAMTGVTMKVPVVCVGNFTLGGAGKTPAAIMLARMLTETGARPFFLTRGYGGSVTGPKLVDAATDLARDVGDEPLLLARFAPTVVASDRVAGAELATRRGATVVIMDDGLQNPSLTKDFTLAVIDGRRGLGNARVFPAGPLRAGLQAQIAKTDALLIVGDNSGAADVETDARRNGLPVLHGRLTPDAAAVAALAGHKTLAFAGIGDPQKFFETARAAGLAIDECRSFPDHHRFTEQDAADLVAQADRNSLTLLTTEKDGARIAGEPELKSLAVRAKLLPVSMTTDEASKLRDLLASRLRR